MTTLSTVSVITPAYNEAEALARLLPRLNVLGFGEIIVADNGSTDATADVARAHGARVVSAPQRGYGAACAAGIAALRPECRVVAFIDGDLSDEPEQLPALCAPILADEADLVMGWRRRDLRAPGTLTPPQAFGTWLAVTLLRLGWGVRYHDLGPMRAIRRDALLAMDMQDRAFGWTVEMQAKAAEMSLRIRELPVPYHKRVAGRSKISGTIRGVWLAGYWILSTLGRLYFTRRRRANAMRGGVQ